MATIGLSLGILNQADVLDHRRGGDRDVVHGAARPAADDAHGAHDRRRGRAHRCRAVQGCLRSGASVRVLVPTAGGPNALGAARLRVRAVSAQKSESPVTSCISTSCRSGWERFKRLFTSSQQPGRRGPRRAPGEMTAAGRRRARALDPPGHEPRASPPASSRRRPRSYDLIVIGRVAARARRWAATCSRRSWTRRRATWRSSVRGGAGAAVRSLIVPIDGSLVSRMAVEFAGALSPRSPGAT